MELYLKYGFALLCLAGGIVLYALGTGNEVAAGLVSAAVGLVAGRAGTVSTAVHRKAVERARTGEHTAVSP